MPIRNKLDNAKNGELQKGNIPYVKYYIPVSNLYC